MKKFTREARVTRRKRKRERIFEMLRRYKAKRRCAACGGRGNNRELELDHVIPRYLGGRPRKRLLKGSTSWSQALYYMIHPNVQVLCYVCHRIKTNQDSTSERETGAKPVYLPNLGGSDG